MSGKLFCFTVLSALAIGPCLKAQQAYEPIQIGSVTFTGNIRDRLEDWRWFTPSSATNPKYTFDDATIRLGLSQNLHLFDWTFEIETPVLLNLPSNSVATGAQGQLGQGASYYVANSKQSNTAFLDRKS